MGCLLAEPDRRDRIALSTQVPIRMVLAAVWTVGRMAGGLDKPG